MKCPVSSLLQILLLLGLSRSVVSSTPIVGAPVNTTSGLISGHAARNRTTVSEYLGIPYAQPPVGDLRFEPPVAFVSSEPFIAANYSLDCPCNPTGPVAFPNKTANFDRIFGLFTGQGGHAQGEDCLSLNIWAKANGKQGKAVLVWIYGGRFNIGATNNPFYQGQYMADNEDVIVVSFNYRINIFGFSGAPNLTQNVGLLDQRLAIEWVYNNIESFGGSNQRITVFGQSAGGASVDFYAYAYPQDPLVVGLISQSGTSASIAPNTLDQATTFFYEAASILGCGSSGDVLPCVRSQNVSAILAAIAKVPTLPTKALAQPVFAPTIDEVIVFSDYPARAAAGKLAHLPYLAGSLDNESGFYKIGAFAAGVNLTDEQWLLFDLEAFTCATAIATQARSTLNIPTWHYRYFGDWSNLRLYPGSGAYHGSDIEMVLGTGQDVSLEQNSFLEQKTSAYMMGGWAAFAEDPQSGLQTYGWGDGAGEKLIRLGFNNETTASFVDPETFDGPCRSLNGSLTAAQGAF